MSLPALPSNWRQAAKAPATRDQYQKVLKQFVLAGFTLPSSPGQLLRYLEEQGARFSASTLEQRISAIGLWHRESGFADPVTAEVKSALQALRRLKRHQPRRKAAALSRSDLQRLLSSCDDGSLSGRRDGLLLSLGLAAALRRSELAGLDWSDVRPGDKGLGVQIRHSKTDQQGQGRTLVIPPLAPPWDPALWLQGWREGSGLKEGPLLVAISRNGRLGGKRLTGHGINHIIQKRAQRLGLAGVSAHSLRRAFATLAVQAGVGLTEVAAVGRWRSLESLKEYVDAQPREAIARALAAD
ncbi:tyrosine-type recombinase/integrase [Gallaecimonas sp. GXIMD4217]|uniref:tyrosine-type recombinase/integrase n=1 Tax=Gallaecimonas sp. GXIMD4217 TaxID=3131927 RepID=UPI00311AE852